LCLNLNRGESTVPSATARRFGARSRQVSRRSARRIEQRRVTGLHRPLAASNGVTFRATRPPLHPGGSTAVPRLGVSASARAMLISRGIVFFVGIGAFLAFGNGPSAKLDFLGLTGHLGAVGNALAAPVIHWDGVWYLALASHGYHHTVEAAFFPLYPLVTRALHPLTGSIVIAAVAASLVAFFTALVLLYRLAMLELGDREAQRSVYLLALFPSALFFSAAYTESLFLCLEVGAVLAARRGRWTVAGLLGGLGAATRNSGILILIPLVLLYVCGPREDRESAPKARPSALLPFSKLRFPLQADAWWLCLVPLGLAAVVLLNVAIFDDPLAGWHAQARFHRSFAGPLSAVWQGAEQAGIAVDQLAAGHASVAALRKLALLGTALAGLAAAVGVFRRLPLAYGAYSAALLLWTLSTPVRGAPLASAPRFILTVFPLFMWLGWRVSDRRAFGVTITAFAVGLGYCSALFATWRFVA